MSGTTSFFATSSISTIGGVRGRPSVIPAVAPTGSLPARLRPGSAQETAETRPGPAGEPGVELAERAGVGAVNRTGIVGDRIR